MTSEPAAEGVTRRIFLAGTIGALFASVGQASAGVDPLSIGAWPAPGLLEAVGRLASVGSRSPAAVSVLAAPGCAKAGRFLSVLRTAPAEIRWVPFGWSASDDVRVAAFLRSGLSGIETFLSGEGFSGRTDASDILAAQVQRGVFEREVAILLFRSTARVPAAPTLILPTGPGSARVVRGAPDAEVWRDMAAIAAATSSR